MKFKGGREQKILSKGKWEKSEGTKREEKRRKCSETWRNDAVFREYHIRVYSRGKTFICDTKKEEKG